MIIDPNKDPYYSRQEVSNSDLGELSKLLMPEQQRYDVEIAYRFGRLIDCMITEPDKVNYFKLTCGGELYTAKEFEQAERMKNAFWKDPFCSMLAKNSEAQKNLY